MIREALSVFCILFLSACADGFTTFPVTEQQQIDLDPDVDVVRLSSKNIRGFAQPTRPTSRTSLPNNTNWEYRIGVGDILGIIVYDHPELNMPAGADKSAIDNGFRIQSDGTFFYPHIGQVHARGRSVEDVRNELSQKLKAIIPEPQVVARVAEFNSQNVVVGGAVNASNRQTLNAVALTLLQAINAAGGYTQEADISRISLQRAGRKYIVDLNGFLKSNYARNNPVLRAGDIVNVPERRTQEAYILGEVAEPNIVDLSVEPVSLTQALTYRGGLNQIRADARGVFVFRNVAGKTTVYQLETSSPAGWLLGTNFTLRAGDVVYVTRSPLMQWNDTISNILPTVLATKAIDDIVY